MHQSTLIITVLILLSVTQIVTGQDGNGTENLTTTAIKIDSSNINLLKGEWKVKYAKQFLRDSVRDIKVQFFRISFMANRTLVAKVCSDCYQTKLGGWKIIQGNLIQIDENQKDRIDFELKGDWIIHKLTFTELTLIKKLTTSGSWTKTWTFER